VVKCSCRGRRAIVGVRNDGPTEAPETEAMSWPIRLLIVVGVNDPAIEAQREVEKIEDVLRTVNRLVDVEVIEYPTINDLEEKCKCFRPHVFHYIGHGGSTKGKNAYILLRGPQQNGPWTAVK